MSEVNQTDNEDTSSDTDSIINLTAKKNTRYMRSFQYYNIMQYTEEFPLIIKWAKSDAINNNKNHDNYCQECFVNLGECYTRQLCGKYRCDYH